MVTFIIPWFGKKIPARNQRCIDISRATIEAAGHTLEVRKLPSVGDAVAAAIAKDLLAFELATTIPNLAVFDADLEIKSVPTLDPGKPFFIHEFPDDCHPHGTPRIGFFFVNGCCEWFVNLQAEKKLRGIVDCYGFPNKLLRDKTVGLIPESSYVHHRFTSGKL
jgi:hypothetical protein